MFQLTQIQALGEKTIYEMVFPINICMNGDSFVLKLGNIGLVFVKVD